MAGAEGKARVLWGVLGGMGGLASAEFARTVYEYNAREAEQDSPVVILYSDPTFPDRTQAFFDNATGAVGDLLTDRLAKLQGLGATRVVLCCVTLHYALPRVPAELRRGVVSLVEVALKGVAAAKRRQLMLCTSGARAARVFQGHELWPGAEDYVVWPDDEDQRLIHRTLYAYKVDGRGQPLLPHLGRLLDKYHADSFVAGCTELHLAAKYLLSRRPEFQFIDPLMEIARNLDAYAS